MIPFLHIPSRDARDADHMAILLAVGSAVTLIRLGNYSGITQTLWLAMSIIGICTAPLLWIRIPYAKWGGVIAALLLATPLQLRVIGEGPDLHACLLLLTCLVIAYWYGIIDYDHQFE
ncbi:MAG: hypothetical protein ACI9UA_000205 [Pseudoalteromonas tetraodonis]